MPNKPGVELISGATEVAEAQKPVQLSTTETKGLLGVFVTCDSSNTGTIVAVGGSKAGTEAKKELGKNKGIVLEKKMAPVFIEVNDLSKVWVDVEKAKDIVTWTALVA
jgi:hypothetical protein